MSTRSIISLLSLALILAFAAAQEQTEKKLSAREIFYSPPVQPAPAQKKTASPKKVKETKPSPISDSQSASVKSPPAPAPPKDAAGVQTLPVSLSSEESAPLGLRYSIVKRQAAESVEVDPDTVFHSGDRIRLRIDVNTSGYLYVINRGSSGNWNILFPSEKIAEGDNRVQKGIRYEIPPGHVFTFDQQPGKERLFIVFARRPVLDLEELIYSLSDKEKSKKSTRPDKSKILLAQADIRDDLVDRLRNIYSRDLIVEKVDETKTPVPSAPVNEKAVYVVNPSRSAESRVVADITLSHE